MPANIPELWEQAVTEKQTDLRYAFNKGSTSRRFEELIALDGLDDFEQTLGQLCDEYETRGDVEFVRDKLQPQLETVKQICLAFQNVTQSSIIASATLGAVLVVIYVSLSCSWYENLMLHNFCPIFRFILRLCKLKVTL